MKLSHGLGLIVAGLGTSGLMFFTGATATGCGSSSGGSNSSGSSSSSSSSGGSSSSSGSSSSGGTCTPTTCNEPPTPPTGGMAAGTKSHNYALHDLFLGDTDRMGVTSADAWKDFGYDLDGKITTAASTDVCTLVAGSSKQVQVDGTKGTDNSFGANIIPIITTLDSTASQALNQSIQGGSFTVFTYVTGFDDSAGNMTTATGLSGVLLAGGKYSADGGAPSWDLQTNWPVIPDPGLIMGCTTTGGCPAGTDPVAKAVIKFSSAFQTKGTFVNGTPSPLTLSLSIGGQSLSLNVSSAVISFDPMAPGSVTNGTIAGVLDTMALINGLMSVAGHISTSLCMGSAFQSIATQIEQTSDIVLNGTNVENKAGEMCNAISIGLGFNSTEIAPPTTIAAPSAPAPNPCDMDGGSE
jgi:hypothetical protein